MTLYYFEYRPSGIVVSTSKERIKKKREDLKKNNITVDNIRTHRSNLIDFPYRINIFIESYISAF